MKRRLLIVLGWLMLSFAPHAASFDCEKAQSKVEKLICADAGLSKLDEELNAAYKTALQSEKRANSARQTQKQWLTERNSCADAACVKRTYETRLKALGTSDWSANSGKAEIPTSAQTDKAKLAEQEFPQTPPKLRYTFCDRNKPGLYCEGQTGKGYSVCEAYLKQLQTLTNPPTCEAPIPPGFKQPDWEEMDVTQHLDLAYQAEGFFLRIFGGYKHPDFDTWRQAFLQEIHDGKISPRMRKVRVTPNDKGDATILAYTRDRNACHKQPGLEGRDPRLGMPPSPVWGVQGNVDQLWAEQGNVHFILPDDTPHTLQFTKGYTSSSLTDLLLYSDRPYFVRITRIYSPLYKNREEQEQYKAGLVDPEFITLMENSLITLYAFSSLLPDRRLELNLNHYLTNEFCQFRAY